METGPKCPECHALVLLRPDWKPGHRGFCLRCGVPLVVEPGNKVRRPTPEELMEFMVKGGRQ